MLRAIGAFLSDHPAIQWLLAIGWLTALVLWPRRKRAQQVAVCESEPKPNIVIAAPIQNDGVGYRHMVSGSVTPPGTPLQVLVASNGPWQLQGPVEVRDSVWSVECTFGSEEKPDGSYNLIAVLGEELKEKTYSDLLGHLPDGVVTSNVVSVQRRLPDKTLLCPNQRLHEIAESDRANIGERLTLIGVDCVTHFGDVPYIEFIFWVSNLALVSVSIDDALVGDGRIAFYKDRQNDPWRFFRPPTLDNNLAKGCFFRGKHRFTIRQEMSPEEAALVERSADDSFFYFGDLRITMHGEGFSGVPFRIGSTVEKKAGLWADAFGDTDSQGKNKLAEVERQHKKEMQELKNRLPAYGTLCAIHGAGLHFIDELQNNRLSDPKRSVESWWIGLKDSVGIRISVNAMDKLRNEAPPIPDSPEELKNWMEGQMTKLAALMNGLWKDDQD